VCVWMDKKKEMHKKKKGYSKHGKQKILVEKIKKAID